MKNSVYAPHTFSNIIQGTFRALGDRIKSSSRWLIVYLLCAFTGVFGFHRFAVKKIGTGILYLFTFGFFGIGVTIDMINILFNRFPYKRRKRDKNVKSGFSGFTRFFFISLYVLMIQYIFIKIMAFPFQEEIIQMIGPAWEDLKSEILWHLPSFIKDFLPVK